MAWNKKNRTQTPFNLVTVELQPSTKFTPSVVRFGTFPESASREPAGPVQVPAISERPRLTASRRLRDVPGVPQASYGPPGRSQLPSASIPSPSIAVPPLQEQPRLASPQLSAEQAPPRGATIPAIETDDMTPVITTENATAFLKTVSSFSPTSWHRFIVKTPIYDKTTILKAINRAIFPVQVVPYYFHLREGILSFLSTNCNEVILSLCKLGMKVRSPDKKFPEIEFEIRVNARKLNLGVLFRKIASSRLDKAKKYLDYSSLENIPELQDIMRRPCSNQELMRQLLNAALELAPDIVAISLSNNGLENTLSIKAAYANKRSSTPWRVLDLSYNEFKSAADLNLLRMIPLTELYLHQNPLCCKYDTAEMYISTLRVTFPKLIKVDGTYLHHTPRLPFWKPNFILRGSYGDSCELANQFLKHYYRLYDDDDRTRLYGVYHKNACFSLSSANLPGQTVSAAKLNEYTAESRNLLRYADMSKVNTLLHRGNDDIVDFLEKLPRTEHDSYSFTVDVMQHSALCTNLTVTGLFRETEGDKTQPPPIRHFMRTFVLVSLANNEYQIVNDMLHITNANPRQEEEAFRYSAPKQLRQKIRRNLSDQDKKGATRFLSELTEMNPMWSRKCLEDTEWDLREAIKVFTALLKIDEVPHEAFFND